MKTLFLTLVLSLFLFIGCVESTKPELKPHTTISNIRFTQTYYEILDMYSACQITFDIENTGNVNISHWKVMFTVTTVHSDEYTGWILGANLLTEEVRFEKGFINTNGDKAFSIEFNYIKYNI